ncbi:HEAT repeat domain-containing protein [Paraburkholderia nodosa]|uniref:HEAT repeat domain-containing protein n=1 Tax=Paraburkholderia nodosa TaxID=392320 RepID=UPI00048638FC|nr:HEAT repeat domain-containing protein [Paraburkholderia nodosa]
MRQELVELIQRMTRRNDVTSSDNSTSWQAHREAELLADETLVDELIAYLDEKPTKDHRSAAYFIIGKIGKNCVSEECALHLIEYTSKETDKYALAILLEQLADIPKPESVDVRALFPLLKDERWLVRRAAIQSLKRCQRAEAEDKLLEILTTTADPIDAIYCQATLNQIGTRKSLPALARSLKSRKRDVKASAYAAIEAIKARDC